MDLEVARKTWTTASSAPAAMLTTGWCGRSAPAILISRLRRKLASRLSTPWSSEAYNPPWRTAKPEPRPAVRRLIHRLTVLTAGLAP